MKVAAVNWKLRDIAREEEFYDHLREMLDGCKGCDVVVLPELFGLELLNVFPMEEEGEIPPVLAPHFEPIRAAIADWHRANPVHFLAAGSGFEVDASLGAYANRSVVLPASARGVLSHGKVVVTEWEKGIGVTGSAGLEYSRDSLCGVTICLDAEFPGSGRALAEAGMLFQCVPAWTESMHGYRRVRWACQARAVENQVCVIHSSLVGQVAGLESHGSSAVIVPPHLPFPLDPVLAETPMDEEGIAIAEVDPEDLLRCRETGEVRNWRDRDSGDWTVTFV